MKAIINRIWVEEESKTKKRELKALMRDLIKTIGNGTGIDDSGQLITEVEGCKLAIIFITFDREYSLLTDISMKYKTIPIKHLYSSTTNTFIDKHINGITIALSDIKAFSMFESKALGIEQNVV